jgi:hypothetical protein
MSITTQGKLLGEALAKQGETKQDVIACTLTDKEMKEEFDDGFGGPEGKAFFAWTNNYVYFCVCHDGAEWVDSVPRNPRKFIEVDRVGGS